MSETNTKNDFGFTLNGTPDEQRDQMLRLILETTLEAKAKLDALITHFHCEIANHLYPDSHDDGLEFVTQMATRFEKRYFQTLEKTMGDIAARRV